MDNIDNGYTMFLQSLGFLVVKCIRCEWEWWMNWRMKWRMDGLHDDSTFYFHFYFVICFTMTTCVAFHGGLRWSEQILVYRSFACWFPHALFRACHGDLLKAATRCARIWQILWTAWSVHWTCAHMSPKTKKCITKLGPEKKCWPGWWILTPPWRWAHLGLRDGHVGWRSRIGGYGRRDRISGRPKPVRQPSFRYTQTQHPPPLHTSPPHLPSTLLCGKVRELGVFPHTKPPRRQTWHLQGEGSIFERLLFVCGGFCD